MLRQTKKIEIASVYRQTMIVKRQSKSFLLHIYLHDKVFYHFLPKIYQGVIKKYAAEIPVSIDSKTIIWS